MCHDWPKPPIWPEDLPLIRELLRRTVQVLPNGPLLDYKQVFGEQELKAPNAAGTLGASPLTRLRSLCHGSIGLPVDQRVLGPI